jgi:hypothetical protein
MCLSASKTAVASTLSRTSGGDAQAAIPSDTNKTPAGCPRVALLSPKVHPSCQHPDPAGGAPTIAPNAALRPQKTEGYTSRVVDVSSTESLPQLSDVLHALTESQQLLLAKVRALHKAAGSRGVHDAPTQADLRQGPDTAFSDSDSALRPCEANGSLRPSLPDVGADSGRTPDREVEPETIGVSPQAITASAEPEMAPEFDAGGRNYNFFDELDAKLARMDELGREG